MITPSGKHLGRRPDAADDRDRRFLAVHPEAARLALPPSVDLRQKIPPCWDQGELGSCGAQMGAALMCFLYPEVQAFSRLQIYHGVREIEGTVSEDAGVQTRDVFKTLAQTGAAPEELWPYDISRFTEKPPQSVYEAASKYKLKSYSRLISGSNYLQCLASGNPFGLGIMLYESFDDEQTNRTGIMRTPQPSEKEIGGHDVTCVGFILNFKSDPLFTKSGMDPALVSDEMLMIRNSWGTRWSRQYRGNFFMPLQYALDRVLGNDAWTARR